MTEEARNIVGKLRCAETELKEVGSTYFEDDDFGTGADLIESLLEQLEQVTNERDGLNIMLAQAQAMLETRTKERDAAVGGLARYRRCIDCARYDEEE